MNRWEPETLYRSRVKGRGSSTWEFTVNQHAEFITIVIHGDGLDDLAYRGDIEGARAYYLEKIKPEEIRYH